MSGATAIIAVDSLRTLPTGRVLASSLLVLLIVATPILVRAAPCGGTTQAALDICADSHRIAADVQLDEAYKQVVARLQTPDDRLQLVALGDAERAWIEFHDAECRFESAGSYGGSMNPMVVADCLATLSNARATTLSGMATCHSRDGSCILGP